MKPSDTQHRYVAATRWTILAGALVLTLGLPAGTWAQAPTPPRPATPPAAESRGGLRAALEAKYEILAGHGNGVVLKPRTEELGVRTIEVSGDTIAVNGEKVSEGVLRAWLGEQAEPIVRLWRVSPGDRQAALGLKRGGSTGEREIPDTASPGAREETPSVESTAGDTAGTEEGEQPEEAETPETPEPAALPARPEVPSGSGGRVKVLGGVTVHKDEAVDEAVAVLGSVRVDGEVADQAVAVLGSVEINGKVGGDVVAVGGSVRLGRNAEVMGDVVSVGGGVYRAEGAKIHGSVEEVGMGGSHWGRGVDVDWGWGPWGFFSASMDVVWKLMWMVALSLLVFLCLLMARRQVDVAEYHVAVEPWKAGVVGFLAQLLFLPMLFVVSILLIITIVGCALFLLYPFLFVGVLLAALVGYAAVAHRLGRALERRFDRRFGSPYAVALIGVMSIEVWGLIGRIVGLGGGVVHLLAVMILVFGFAAQYAAWTVGFGAVILARLNRTSPGWEGTGLSLSPPPPATPPAPPPGPVAPEDLPLSEREPRDSETEQPPLEP